MTNMPVSKAVLSIECATINPPKPLGIAVLIGRKIIATIELDEFRNVCKRLQELEKAQAA